MEVISISGKSDEETRAMIASIRKYADKIETRGPMSGIAIAATFYDGSTSTQYETKHPVLLLGALDWLQMRIAGEGR